MKFIFSPSKEFKENAKMRYLAAFGVRYPSPAHPRASEFILAMRSLAIVLGVAAVVLGGASVYADTKNVPADNPLYPLKRLGESVQLALTAPAAKPQLEAALAARRAGEITDLVERHLTSTLIPNLTNDLNSAVNASIVGAEMEGEQQGRSRADVAAAPAASSTPPVDHGSGKSNSNSLAAVCGTLGSFLNHSSSLMENGLIGRSNALKQFEARCGSESLPGDSGDSANSKDASSSTFPASSTFPRVRGDRGSFEFHENATTTENATATVSVPFLRHGDDDGRGE